MLWSICPQRNPGSAAGLCGFLSLTTLGWGLSQDGTLEAPPQTSKAMCCITHGSGPRPPGAGQASLLERLHPESDHWCIWLLDVYSDGCPAVSDLRQREPFPSLAASLTGEPGNGHGAFWVQKTGSAMELWVLPHLQLSRRPPLQLLWKTLRRVGVPIVQRQAKLLKVAMGSSTRRG